MPLILPRYIPTFTHRNASADTVISQVIAIDVKLSLLGFARLLSLKKLINIKNENNESDKKHNGHHFVVFHLLPPLILFDSLSRRRFM